MAEPSALAGAAGSMRIVEASEQDVPLILSFIKKLAVYEKLPDQVVATEKLLRESLFGARRVAEVALAYLNSAPAGFALFFHTFSTFQGRPGIYLEDLYVEEQYRKRGIGRALLVHLARLAQERGCGRLEWSALKFNRLAIDFYLNLGAAPMDDWTIFRVEGPALEKLAGQEIKNR